MEEDRRKAERRTNVELTEDRVANLEDAVESIKARVYNGLGKELRKEVADGLQQNTRIMLGILVAMVLAMAGFIINGGISSRRTEDYNTKLYSAILQLDKKIDIHLAESELRRNGVAQ